MLIFSLIFFFIGLALLAISGISFRIRALANKTAWGGITIPFALVGIPILLISLILLYFNYPR
ncbi:hypothetical protein [Enterococcus rivorum]|uniref:Uncharacterized protein n=1 Tax=Enterococcus rivorum TaxID=762845 RepID=A0A1E5KT21_9ENTE|nr:hypothetical protein [Enterococcus rivorum]MBP2098083.1 hypothetical protein [Enterococcus rivorum]OEH81024.1 hypothetical protein BCR26_05795 [Enterococcus rivorum]